MTVRPAHPDAVDAEVVQRHVETVGDSWRDPVRRRRLFDRAVRLRKADPRLPDFQVIPDERDGAGLLVSSAELLIRREDLAGREDAFGRSGMVAEPVEALGGRVARLVPATGAPRRGIVDRSGDLRRDQVPAEFSYITAMAVVIKSLGGAEPAQRHWPPLAETKAAGAAVRVAVVDTGVTRQPRTDGWLAGLAHDPGNIDELDTSPRNGMLDAAAGHGTAVAGLVQQEAPEVALAVHNPVPPDGAATETAVAAAMVAAVQEAFAAGQSVVLNLSLGTTTTDDRPPVALQAAVDEIEALAAASPHEALIVAAAGNYGEDRPVFPGAIPGVVAVGALQQDMAPAPWSSYGDWVTCSVIGDGVLSTYVEGAEDPEFDPVCPDTFGPDPFALHFGTSFAAPQVAARVARVAQEEGIGLRQALDRVLDGAPARPGYGRVLQIQPAIGG
jgi:Subtilase family